MSHLLIQQTLKALADHGLQAQTVPSSEEGCEIIDVTLIEISQELKLTLRILMVEQPLSLQELAHPLEYWASEPADSTLKTAGYQSMNAAQAMADPHAGQVHHESPTSLYEVQVETILFKDINEASVIDLMRLAHLLNRGMMGGYFCIDEMARSVLLKMNGLFSTQQSSHFMAQLGQYLFFLAAHYDAFYEIHSKKTTFANWLEKTTQLIQEAPGEPQN